MKGWGFPGGDHAWNGDTHKPTLRGSIPGTEWHGYLVDGELTLEKPDG